jgi:hypothetical protein
MNKVIITCAVTGAIHTPSMSPYLPVTPEEIIEAAVVAADAGAAADYYGSGLRLFLASEGAKVVAEM